MSLIYLPHDLVTMKLYNHGLGIFSSHVDLLNLLGFFLYYFFINLDNFCLSMIF
jgi:hypothetical protein